MSAACDVLIVGGGVIGLSAAYYLAREKVAVTLIDRGDMGQEASWAGAGIIPPASNQPSRNGVDELHRLSFEMFPTLSAELSELSGIDNGFRRSGGLEFLAGEAASHAGEWSAPGVRAERLDEPASRRLEPRLAVGLGTAFHLPDLAQVRNPRHVRALTEACRYLGVELRPHEPLLAVRQQNGRIVSVHTNQGDLSTGQFLFASGAWTGDLLEGLGMHIPVQPVRGQIALINTGKPLVKSVLLWGALYLVPRDDGRVLVGSTEERVGFEKSTTKEAIDSLLALAYRLVPDLAHHPVEKCWAGLRPGSPDGRPLIGPLPGLHNAFIASGHFRSGIQLSPGTGLVCKEMLLQQPLSAPLESMRPDRFSDTRAGTAFPI